MRSATSTEIPPINLAFGRRPKLLQVATLASSALRIWQSLPVPARLPPERRGGLSLLGVGDSPKDPTLKANNRRLLRSVGGVRHPSGRPSAIFSGVSALSSTGNGR
jgi:hypothetical protein